MNVEQKNEFIKANAELEKLKEIRNRKQKKKEKQIEEFAVKKQQMQDLMKLKKEETFRESNLSDRKSLICRLNIYKTSREDKILFKQIKEADEKAKQEDE
jgi:hypothetical protein